jgi:hypothetical protein
VKTELPIILKEWIAGLIWPWRWLNFWGWNEPTSSALGDDDNDNASSPSLNFNNLKTDICETNSVLLYKTSKLGLLLFRKGIFSKMLRVTFVLEEFCLQGYNAVWSVESRAWLFITTTVRTFNLAYWAYLTRMERQICFIFSSKHICQLRFVKFFVFRCYYPFMILKYLSCSKLRGQIIVRCKTRNVSLSLCLSKHHAMKTHVGVKIYVHALLTSAVDRGALSASLPCSFTPGEGALVTHCMGDWMDQRPDLDTAEKTDLCSCTNQTQISGPLSP